jgi:hypothetical protein
MNRLIITLMFAATCTFAQLPAPTLEQIKLAADAGDPSAQVKMGERDPAQAEMWYRNAANHGYARAQGKLGNLLLLRIRSTIGLKSDARAALADETLKWATLAANQGDKQGQANLAEIYLDGKLVKQDLIEAYKWGELADKTPGQDFIFFTGASTRDAAILKMNADQIAEARRRVAEFKPHIPLKSEVPAPAWVKKIKLNGISGGPNHRLATIGKATFESGERGTVKVGDKQVSIQCLEINDKTATISIEGVEGTQTLSLN